MHALKMIFVISIISVLAACGGGNPEQTATVDATLTTYTPSPVPTTIPTNTISPEELTAAATFRVREFPPTFTPTFTASPSPELTPTITFTPFGYLSPTATSDTATPLPTVPTSTPITPVTVAPANQDG